MKTCHVVGAGDFDPRLLERKEGDFVIAADAGYAHLQSAGVLMDLYVGDGDSLGFTPSGSETVLLPKVKDDTDVQAAVKAGLERGFRRFLLYGVLGGKRFSHSLANLEVLIFLAEKGADGVLIHPDYSVRLLTPGTFVFDGRGGYFSLFDFEGKASVSVRGAKYPLDHAPLPPGLTLGASNEGTEKTEVTVHTGRVFWVREK